VRTSEAHSTTARVHPALAESFVRTGAAARFPGPTLRHAAAVPLVILFALLAACGGVPAGPQTSSGAVTVSPTTVAARASAPTSSAGTTSTPAPTSTSIPARDQATVPPNGTVFGDFRQPSSGIDLTGAGGGDVHIIGSGHGFAVISASSDGNRDTSVLVAFAVDGTKLGTVPTGQFEGSCGAEDLTLPDGRRLLFTEMVTTTPAQGIIPATHTVTLQAWDARTGQSAWQLPLPIPDTVENVDCHGGDDGTMEFFAPTSDHAWAYLIDGRGLVAGTVVDLASGAPHRVDQVYGTIGTYLLAPSPDDSGSKKTAAILDPAKGTVLGSIPDQVARNFNFGLAYAPGPMPRSRQADSPAMVLTSDGQGIVTQDPTSTGIVRYDLPSGTLRWRHEAANGGEWHHAQGDGGGVVLDGVESSPAQLVGLNDATGEQVWTLPLTSTDVCSVTDNQMAVIANSQLATIDVKTGRQLSYGQSPYAGVATGAALCPDSLPGGLAVAQLQIAQIAQP